MICVSEAAGVRFPHPCRRVGAVVAPCPR